MGVKTKSRLVALIVAVMMVFTSAAAVFADTASSTAGTNNANKATVYVGKGKIVVKNTKGIVKTSKGKISGKTVTGLKEGQKVTITTKEGKSYRWVKQGVIKSATKSKITWKKASGAKYYLVKIVKNGKAKYKRVSAKNTSITAKKLGVKSLKGYKVYVRPLAKSGGKIYSGELSKGKTVK